MRPVVLRMESFAAFREPTVVDFTGADYFVLVGPTGAGKSTVVDAMTFALYGSVPRWDDRRAVRLALAPTAGRGTVSLVFDVGGERYVVARELRRAASGSVTVREARLEKLVDPNGTGEPGEDTIPVEDGSSKVSEAVETLLGLPFDDFCTCVVLPQGDFADFLHAAPRERQDKLERILGLGVYDQIMRRANGEARTQQDRVEFLDEQLERYAADTAEAENAAARRVTLVTELETRVGELVPRLESLTAERDAARTAAATASAERTTLAGLTVPDGVAELDARRARDLARSETAAARAEEAERADAAARAARAAAPGRERLEQVRERHAELARLDAARPGLLAARDDASAAAGAATAAVTAASAAEDDARAAHERASSAAAEAETAVATLVADRDALAALGLPDGLDDLATRRADADAALADHDRVLAEAEAAEETVRAAVADAPEREPLERARRDHESLAAARDAARAAETERQRARNAADEAGQLRDGARHRLEHARSALAAAERADLAAVLRPALVEGDDCPVCAQTVAVLPPPLPDGDLAALRSAVEEAQHADEAAQADDHRARATATTATGAAERAAAEVDRLEFALAGRPDAAGVDAALDDLRRRAADAESAATAVRAARRDRDAATERVASLRRDADSLASGLQSAREPLGRIEPGEHGQRMPASAADPVAGWHDLVAWAAAQSTVRDAAIPAARETAASAVRDRDTAGAALAAARERTAAARTAETAAVRAEQQAVSTLDAADGRAGELRAALDGAPTDARAATELERVAALERDAAAAEAAMGEARAELRAARADTERTGRDVAAAQDELRNAREAVLALGPPSLPEGPGLEPAWSALTTWAVAETAIRDERVRDATATAEAADAARDGLLAGLRDELTRSQVPVGAGERADELARRAPAAVATALAEAKAEHARITLRRAEADELRADHATARERQQVARTLGNQLRSDRFPQWLVASALDALVTDASKSLAVLSGGQFALTHDKGEFLVVDHADADALRPVKTLSGGETFQASLALALALSDQLSGLAAQGAPRLESIFLDEGFGTLDEANLETVASTLENLATRGDRMVGVITHVAALAERIPVRFVVRRDQRTSTIERADGGGQP
ncbi:AAA family ATPase [Pseudonocardia endophytica]|uniref:Nuclease SbcCD subunit C n=1 Tax=Pseudonocardia endophytica TaxID=401976 RepID=A0A4R1HK86_PSEEN|nr:AAA family ATPase [Pseudonocardia endophytica]TCK22804.1 exonuclease SbcC [Pseudonocardia endophytica]